MGKFYHSSFRGVFLAHSFNELHFRPRRSFKIESGISLSILICYLRDGLFLFLSLFFSRQSAMQRDRSGVRDAERGRFWAADLINGVFILARVQILLPRCDPGDSYVGITVGGKVGA